MKAVDEASDLEVDQRWCGGKLVGVIEVTDGSGTRILKESRGYRVYVIVEAGKRVWCRGGPGYILLHTAS